MNEPCQDTKNIEHETHDLLDQWQSLSHAQRRALIALANEVDTASELIETSMECLSERFLKLAVLAQNQSKRIIDFSNATTQIETNGQSTTLPDVFRAFDIDISNNLDKIICLSKNGVSLSYTLEDAHDNLNELIDKMREGKEVSLEELQHISAELQKSKEELKEVASLDVSDVIHTKERICMGLSYAIQQSEDMEKILNESMEESSTLSHSIVDIVTKMQFQDRTSQRLGHISSTLIVLADLLKEMDQSPNIDDEENSLSPHDTAWVEKMLASMHLGEMRERFAKHALLDGCDKLFDNPEDETDTIDHADASDDIELF